MAVNRRPKVAYGLSEPDFATSPMPILVNRAPTQADFAEVGTLWIDPLTNQAWVLTSVITNIANWLPIGIGIYPLGTDGQVLTAATGGVPIFNDIGAGPAIVITEAPNSVTVGLTNGAAGQVIIGGGAAPTWATLTSTGGTITLTPGANTLNLETTVKGLTWHADATVGPIAMVTDSGYVLSNAGPVQLVLPVVSALGDTLYIIDNNAAAINSNPLLAGGFFITANAGQTIIWSADTSTVTGGTTNAADARNFGSKSVLAQLICTNANTEWTVVSTNIGIHIN